MIVHLRSEDEGNGTRPAGMSFLVKLQSIEARSTRWMKEAGETE